MRRATRLLLLLCTVSAWSLWPTGPVGVTIAQTDEPPAAEERTPAAPPAPAAPAPTGVAEPTSEAIPPPAIPARQAARRAATTAQPSGANVAIIPIEGEIRDFTFESVRRRIERAEREGASVIVLELNTPGGGLSPSLKLSKHLKQTQLPTLAWINPQAYSGGIVIGAACDNIVMAPSAATGDAAPITLIGNLAPTERAKVLSPLLAELKDSAAQNHYDFVLFHAMCVLEVKVFEVRHKKTGEVRLVNEADYKVMVLGAPIDAPPPPTPQPQGPPNATPAVPAPPAEPSIHEVRVRAATHADQGQWELVQQVHDGQTLLTVHSAEAYELGLSQNDPVAQPIRTDADLQRYLSAAKVLRYDESWSMVLAGFLTRWWVRGILIVVLLLGAYVEFQAPGVGLPGLAALTALVLLIGAPYVIGLAEVWHIVLFFLGLMLLIVEVFVTPGFGLLGLGGVIAMFVGLVLMAVPSSGQGFMPMPAAGSADALQQSVLWTLIAIIVSGVGMFYITRYFGTLPILNRLVLKDVNAPAPAGAGVLGGATLAADDEELDTDETVSPPTEPPGAAHVSGGAAVGEGVIAVGATGAAVTPLRPSGRAEINGQTIDVITYGGWLEAGKNVRVVEVHGNRVVVDGV